MHVLLFLATACGPSGEIDRLDDQLEPVRFTLTDSQGDVVDPDVIEAGAEWVTVAGDAPDWTLALGELTVDLHSPTDADVSTLDGQDLSILAVVDPWTQLFALSDDAGPAYVAAASYWPGVFDDVLGAGVVDWGQELGTAKDADGDLYTWLAVAFSTDEGVIELEPGEVEELIIDGVRWRAGVVSAYKKELKQPLDCGPTDIFGVELLRLFDEAPALEPRVISRPLDLEPSAPPC